VMRAAGVLVEGVLICELQSQLCVSVGATDQYHVLKSPLGLTYTSKSCSY
jgi:hypothetical protein